MNCVIKYKIIREQMNKLILLIGFLLIQGCAPSSYLVKTPVPSSISYKSLNVTSSQALAVNDNRIENEKKFSSGILNFELKLDDTPIEPINYLKKNIELEFLSRGIPVNIDSRSSLDIDVQKFQMINHRTSGFSPFVTFTFLKADVNVGNKKEPIGIFIRRGKVPVWSFDEIIEPTLNEPLGLLVKELTAKINSIVYKQSISDTDVELLVQKIKTQTKGKDKATYLDVYQLGFGNNQSAIPYLKELTNSTDEYKRQAAISSLGILKAVDEIDFLISSYVNGSSWTDKAMSLKAIGDLGTSEALAFLKQEKATFADDAKKYWVNDLVDLYL
jgi:hypothetical protein